MKTMTLLLLWFAVAFAAFPFQSAQKCGECHEDIYTQWQTSMHASSTRQADPLYRAMFDWAVKDTDGKARKKCVQCHTPFISMFPDSSLEGDIHSEGVTCQFCHSTSRMEMGGIPANFILSTDTLFSEQPDEMYSSHPVAHRDFFANGQLCLGCHAVMKNPKGIVVCNTGPEYEEFSKKNEKTCLDCHLAPKGEYRNHAFPGSHNSQSGSHPIELQATFDRKSNEIKIALTNTGAGHALPTGSPLRRIILKVTAYNEKGEVVWENWQNDPMNEDSQALFCRIPGNVETGKPTPPWQANGIIYRNLLAPGETVQLSYIVNKQEKPDKIKAVLYFHFAPGEILEKLGLKDLPELNPRTLAEIIIQNNE